MSSPDSSNKRTVMDMMPTQDSQVVTPPPVKRGRVAGREPAPVGEEPPAGMAIGITTVHPLQHWVPMAFKTDEELKGPWSKSPLVKSPDKTLLLLLLDLSPSMACGYEVVPAAAVVSMLDRLPAYLAKTLTSAQMQNTKLAIAAFSGTVGWVNQDHTPHERVFGQLETGNWAAGSQLEAIEAQTVSVNDLAAMTTYIDAWVEKVERIYTFDDAGHAEERGAGTNIEAALYFAHKVAQTYCGQHGGTAQVFLCTDGVATCGDVRSKVIRQTLDDVLFDHKDPNAVPIQVHALMMGSAPKPHSLTAIIGNRGLLGYAKDPDSIAAGLDTILKPAFANTKGSMDFVTFAGFYNVENNALVSELTMTTYSQGEFGVGDNTTALFGALVPDTFRGVGGSCPTEDDAAKLLLRVTGFACPNLLSAISTIRKTVPTIEGVKMALLARGHEILLDQRIPVVTSRWWAPRNLRGPQGDYMSMPSVDQVSGVTGQAIDLLYSKSARETTGLYAWVEKAGRLLQDAQEALGSSTSSRQAAETSKRFSEMASSSGHGSLSRRLEIVRRSSERHADLEDEDETSDFGSAAHVATASLSQA